MSTFAKYREENEALLAQGFSPNGVFCCCCLVVCLFAFYQAIFSERFKEKFIRNNRIVLLVNDWYLTTMLAPLFICMVHDKKRFVILQYVFIAIFANQLTVKLFHQKEINYLFGIFEQETTSLWK